MKITKDIVSKLDKGLRHKSGMTSDEFIKQYCKTFREYAFATHDDSLNEFEKGITHVLGMLIYYRRFFEILGFNGIDPRDFVWQYEASKVAEDEEKKAVARHFLRSVFSPAQEQEKQP